MSGFSPAMMQGLLSANTALSAANAQQSALNKLDNRANLLKAEIKSGNGDVEGRKKELEEVEAQAKAAEQMHMNTLSQAESSLENAGVAETPKLESDPAIAEKKPASGEAKAEAKRLNEAHQDHHIVAVDHTAGMQIESGDKTAVAISPAHLEAMAQDSVLQQRYEGYLADMRALDGEAAHPGITSEGWSVDQSGRITKWVVFTGPESERLDLAAQLTEQGKAAFGAAFDRAILYRPEEFAALGRESGALGLLIDQGL